MLEDAICTGERCAFCHVGVLLLEGRCDWHSKQLEIWLQDRESVVFCSHVCKGKFQSKVKFQKEWVPTLQKHDVAVACKITFPYCHALHYVYIRELTPQKTETRGREILKIIESLQQVPYE